jgi:putative restriction endonuclease
VRGFVASTDQDWYSFLLARPEIDEVNFWRPSGKGLRLDAGTPFFFKLKSPHNAIGGFGYFARASVLPAWLAWEAFGEKNGAASEIEMRRRIESYREALPEHGDYEIGCLMISQPTFFRAGEWVAQPRDWPPNTVVGKTYDVAVGEGRRIYEASIERAAGRSTAGIAGESRPAERYGDPVLIRLRLGQGIFRVAVTDAYGRACAVTGEHSLPVLDAAHIRPYASEGEHDVKNGLLLRTDIHRLFDHGYVTVTPALRFEVSRRLKDDFANGRSYYPLHGTRIHVPDRAADQPDPRLLAWHNEHAFRAA